MLYEYTYLLRSYLIWRSDIELITSLLKFHTDNTLSIQHLPPRLIRRAGVCDKLGLILMNHTGIPKVIQQQQYKSIDLLEPINSLY